MRQELFYKHPGLLRQNIKVSAPGNVIGTYTIVDYVKKTGISVLPHLKQYIELDFTDESGMIDPEMMMNLTDHIRALPERTDEALGKHEIDGRMLQGFLVKEEGIKKTVWIDETSGELVRIDMDPVNISGVSYSITDIEFDIDLDDSLFNLKPPEGFTLKKMDFNFSEPEENDLITFLRFYASHNQDGLFPPTISNQAEFIKSMNMLDFEEKPLDEGGSEAFANSMTRCMMFVMTMKAECDWNYSGKDVKMGSARTPICWWKPEGSNTYRVVFGDLKIRDMAPEELEK